MSGSETGIMASREPYTVGTQNSPAAIQNMQPPFSSEGPTVYRPVTGTPFFQQRSSGSEGDAVGSIISPGYGANISLSGDQIRKKRGRPRKYGPDGNMALSLVSVSPSGTVTLPIGAFSSTSSAAHSYGGTPPSAVNKPRGRPPGSNKRQKLEGSAGVGFTPHVITVKAGEDVSSKIMSFSQHGPRAICILAANGAISNVTLRQPATSGGTVTYEGRFEILSLSGSYLPSESDGQISRTGGLSVSLAGPDGRVVGGSVAGLLTAAAPVQVVVGSFMATDNSRESKAGNPSEPLTTIPKPPGGSGAGGGSSPTSRGTASGSSGGPASPFNQSAGPFNSTTNPPQVMIWK